MNKNEIQGGAKKIIGKAQQELGELTGNKAQQAKGVSRQAEGSVNKLAGKIQSAVEEE